MTSSQPSYAPGRVWHRSQANAPADAVDIGTGTPWATPFRAGRDGNRQEVVEQFDKWVLHAPDVRARRIRGRIGALVGKDLICDCPRGQCHGSMLATLAHLESANAEHAHRPPGTWLRLSTVENGGVGRYLICVTDPGPGGHVIDAVGKARWMIGNRCSVIAQWLRDRNGSATPMHQIADLATSIRDAHVVVEPLAS